MVLKSIIALLIYLKKKLDKVDTDELANIIGRDIYKVRDENERMLQEVRASHEAYQKKIKLPAE
jgi:hypothetical protein